MPRKRTGHRDDHGRCAECYEEWPCSVSLGTKRIGGIDAEAHDAMLIEALEKSNLQLEVTRRCNRLLEALGIDFHVPDFSVGIMIETTMLLDILVRLSESEEVA